MKAVYLFVICCICCFASSATALAVYLFYFASSYTTLLTGSTVTTLDSDNKLSLDVPTFGKDPLAYTISLWLKIPAVSALWRNVFRFGSSDNTRCPGMWITQNQNQIHFRHDLPGSPNWGFDGIPTNIPYNTWFHFAITVSDKTFTPYINGVAQTGKTASTTPSLADATSNKVIIVATPASGTYRDVNSLLQVCDLRFYPSALKAEDITSIATNKPTPLV